VGDVSGINTSLSGTAKEEWLLGNGPLTTGIDFIDEKAEAAPGTSGKEPAITAASSRRHGRT